MYLGSFYNPRYNNAKVLPGLEASMSRLPPDGYKILAGDFNLPDVDWESSSVKLFNTRVYGGSGDQCTFLLNIATTHSLQQLVNFPTRQQNTLDLFFTTNPILVDNVTAIPGISNHDSIAQIEFTSKAKINKKKPHKIYKFHQADFKQIQEEMRKFSEQYFNEDPDKNTIHENWNRLKSKNS